MNYQHTENRSFGPTLEWEELPILGEDRARHSFRAIVWRWVLLGLACFWAGFFALLFAAL